MKKNLLKIFAVTAFFCLAQITISKAQTYGDFRSKQTGNLTDTATWQIFRGPDSLWVNAANVINATATTVPGSTSKMTILNGHTVAINGGTKTVRATFIEAGATLSTDGAARSLRVVDSLMNEGTVGGTASTARIGFEGYKANGNIIIGGSGAFYISTFRSNGIAETLNIIIDANLNVSGAITGFYTLSSGSNTALQGDDNVTITINAGKTVTCGSSSYLHGASSNTNISTDLLGSYTYTINGILDMTGSATSCIVGHNTNNGTVTVNVNGTWKVGNAIRTASNNTTLPTGLVFLNVGTNGVVDITASTATNLVMTNGATNLYTFFNITGNGVIKQNPTKHASQNVFRVGTGGTYSPVTIGAATTPNAVYTVNVSATTEGTKKVVNRVWDISSPTTVPDLTLTFGSVADIEKNGFNIIDPVSVYYWNGATWDTGVAATAVNTVANGAATSVDLHTTQLTLVNSLGKFSIGNETPAILPLKFISVNAKLNATGKQAFINWQTAEEKNTLDFVVEKSTDGVNFNQIGVVGAKSTAGLNNYSFTDNNIDAGTAYYRIKQRDNDGKSDISKVVYVTSKSQIAINLYPNPVVDELNVSYPLNQAAGKITVYNLNGKTVVNQKIIAGSTSAKVNVATLVPSVYIVEINTGSESVVQRFVKQ